MLIELVVSNLGVIVDLSLPLGGGMTALTGETGAGKTLVVEAIDLLLGGRADPVFVRSGADEARVDGRFVVGKGTDAIETVLTRVVPTQGRSRAYIDGHPVPATRLVDEGRRLIAQITAIDPDRQPLAGAMRVPQRAIAHGHVSSERSPGSVVQDLVSD